MNHKHTTAIFVIIVACIFLFLGFQKIVFKRPQSVHQWAQCDRASVALNFGKETFNLFQPRVHNNGNGTGITGMEFPIINYTAGMFYRLSGHLEPWYRIIISLLVLLGLTAAFKIGMILLNDFTFSAAAVLLTFLSPIFIFYTPNFLPDAASTGLILMAWYHFFKFRYNKASRSLLLLSIFGLLAALIKLTTIISIVAMISVTMLEMIIPLFIKDSALDKKNKMRLAFSQSAVILLVITWYAYADWLSKSHASTMFLLEPKVPQSIGQLIDDINFVYDFWGNQYYSRVSAYFFVTALTLLAIFNKYCSRIMLTIIALLTIGESLFFIMMAGQFRDHDYYMVTLTPLIFFILITFFNMFQNLVGQKWKFSSPILKLGLAIMIIHNLTFCRFVFQYRYQPDSWMKSPEIFNKYFDIHHQLRNIGVPDNAEIVSVYDWSTNVTLYLMDLKGIRISPEEGIWGVQKAIEAGAKYLIINDESVLSNETIKPYLNNKLGEINGIFIFKL